jgi:hypothetical protein
METWPSRILGNLETESEIVINPDGLGCDNDCAGEAQQQL